MADQSVSIDLDFRGAGWANCTVHVGEKSLTMNGVSYTTDVLGDILRAGLALATGADRAAFSFDGEPQEWRLLLEAPFDSELKRWKPFSLRILTFADIYVREPIEKGVVLLDVKCSPVEFARAALEIGQRVLNTLGLDGYSEKWNGYNGFPLRALRALEAAVATEEPPPPKHGEAVGTRLAIFAPSRDEDGKSPH